MTATPDPPPEGWTLPEAAAALFPGAWSAAWFPDDVTAARTLPGIEPAPSPWSQVPLDRIAAVTAAVMAGSAIPAGPEAVVAACRSYEAETSQRIAAAMVRRAEQRAALPGLLAARLAGGALMARGVSPLDPLRPVDIPALAWGTAQIALGWEETTWRRGAKPYSSHSSPPPAPGSVTLPGGITRLGVRVFAANRTFATTLEAPVTEAIDRLLDGWLQVAEAQTANGGAFNYAWPTDKALLHDPLDPRVPNLPAEHKRFVAGRSMRDVEATVTLKMRDPRGSPLVDS